jgi:hypothetical protein
MTDQLRKLLLSAIEADAACASAGVAMAAATTRREQAETVRKDVAMQLGKAFGTNDTGSKTKYIVMGSKVITIGVSGFDIVEAEVADG